MTITCSDMELKQAIIRDFLTELSWCASKFTWNKDDGRLRGTHPDYWTPLCPIGAVWFVRCREVVLPWESRLWEVADSLKLGISALAIAEACDDLESMLGKKLVKAVGLKG